MKKYIYIDECGDPEFFGNRGKLLVGKEGFQPLLMIGMIITENRRALWESVTNFSKLIKSDELYNSIHSVKDDGWYLHAKDDYPDIRTKFFDNLRYLDGYETHIIIGRKKLDIFTDKHNSNSSEFYFDLIHHLLKGKLDDHENEYELFLALRQRNNLDEFRSAVKKAIKEISQSDKTIKYNCNIVKSEFTPEMSIIDYKLWALHRYIIKKEERFYFALKKKYYGIYDIYDSTNKGGKKYTLEDPFDLSKAEEFL